MLGIKEYYLFYNGGRGELKILLLTQILVILNLHQHKNRPKHCMSCLAGLKDSLYKVATALINKEFEDLDNIVSNVLAIVICKIKSNLRNKLIKLITKKLKSLLFLAFC